MIIVKNQKGIKELSVQQDLIDKILSNDTKVVVGYGANGKGKSTLKDLFLNDNLEKNFELLGEEQINQVRGAFSTSKLMVFDNDYISNFIYSDDSLHQNQTKVIMKTQKIQELFNRKFEINENILHIINICNKYLNDINNFIDKFNYKTATGTISKPKKRYASTFIKGNLPYKYEELFDIPDDIHKRWWYEGLSIYKNNNLEYCPWCKNIFSSFQNNIKQQLERVEETGNIDTKLFSDKIDRISDFAIIMNNTNINETVKGIINNIIENINISLDNNVESEILRSIDSIIRLLEHDKSIFQELIIKVQTLDNLTELTNIDLTDRTSELEFFQFNEEIQQLSNSINEFTSYVTNIVESIRESNIELHKIINNCEEDLNEILYNLGLKYHIEIDDDNIVSNGLNDNDNYILLKSINGIDISDKVGSTLSYGEKNTLAFAFFIEQLKNCSDYDTIIIFDDPISSYDLFRRYTSLGILNTISSDRYKKIFILSHESNFVSSIVSCYKKISGVDCLIINETADGKMELCSLEPNYSSELMLYKNIMNFSYDFSICQRILALRKLYELYRFITSAPKLNFYDYICKLIHYRKDEQKVWDESYIDEIKKVLDFYGITYDSNIEIIKNETDVFSDMDNLYTTIINKNIYDITAEDIICLRMICEVAVRNESTQTDRYKVRNMKKINDSSKLKRLNVFFELLNAVTHSDDEDEVWPELCLNDLKSIPKIIVSQIIDIIK